MQELARIGKGSSHRAAPLADSPTSCPLSTELKKVQNFLSHHSALIAGTSAKSEPLSGAKVQQNFETAKDLAKKARPLNSKMANADTLEGAGVNSGNALDAAKLQNNSETTKDKEQKKHCHRRTTEHEPNRVANSSSPKRALETASVSHDEEHQHAVISFADGAKVQQNSEITKLSSKKELPPVTPLGTNRRGISKAAQKFGE